MRTLCLAFLAIFGLAAFPFDQAPTPPREARRAFEKAAAALKAKHPDEAIRDYQQAVAIFPAYAEAWYELGKLYRDAQPDDARSAFEAAIRADPEYADAYLALAALEHSARRWKQLIAVTERLLAFNAIDFPQAWLLNSVANYNTGNLAAAEKGVREAERLDPRQNFPESRRLLALILSRRGDFAGEADQLRQYLAAAPTGPDSEAARVRLAQAEKAAGEPAGSASSAAFRTETTLAVVRFQLRPNKGQPAPPLRAEDIEIREDGAAQKIAVFEGGPVSARTLPVEISLLFDCSASVERIAASGPRVFRENLLDEFPNVSIAIYGFSDDLVRLSAPTRDAATLKKAMDLVASIPKRDTPLFGSIADTIRDAAATGANVLRMLVIFSDGESASFGDENRSGEVTRAAAESGTALFPVILTGSGPLDMAAANSVHDFVNLASATGGREFHGMMGGDVLPAILKSLAGEIRSGYAAGFYVPVSTERKPHRIEVVLRSKDQGRIYGGSRILMH